MQDALKFLKLELQQAKLRERPDGEEVPWGTRAVDDESFKQHQENIRTNGLNAKISLFISGNNANQDSALIGLKIEPLEPIMTTKPPYTGTPWHISVGFTNDDGTLSKEATAFIGKYLQPKTVRLKIREVRWNAVTYLADDDSLVLDPIIHDFHQSSYYKDKPLHISF